jgi:hypothetical protein
MIVTSVGTVLASVDIARLSPVGLEGLPITTTVVTLLSTIDCCGGFGQVVVTILANCTNPKHLSSCNSDFCSSVRKNIAVGADHCVNIERD